MDDNVSIYSTWGVSRKGDETAIKGVARSNNAEKCTVMYEYLPSLHSCFSFSLWLSLMSQNSYSVTNANGPQLPITPEFFEKVSRIVLLNMAKI